MANPMSIVKDLKEMELFLTCVPSSVQLAADTLPKRTFVYVTVTDYAYSSHSNDMIALTQYQCGLCRQLLVLLLDQRSATVCGIL